MLSEEKDHESIFKSSVFISLCGYACSIFYDALLLLRGLINSWKRGKLKYRKEYFFPCSMMARLYVSEGDRQSSLSGQANLQVP